MTIDIEDGTAYLTIALRTAESDDTTGIARTALSYSGEGGLGAIAYGTNGSITGEFGFDNFAVMSKTDEVVISSSAITAEADTLAATADEAVTASGDTPAIPNSTKLTADITARMAGGAAVTTTYAWSLADGNESFIGFGTDGSATTATTAEVTLVGKNTTIKDQKATVTCVVTAGSGDTAVTKTFTKTITVLAKQDLLSDMTISATESATSVAAGDTLALTLDGGTKDASLTDDETAVTYAWASSDTTIATVAATDTGATVTGVKEAADAVTITVTATLGSIKKTATYEVTVTESAATLSTLTLSATSGTVAKGFTTTFTAGANDSITPDSWEVTSDSENATVTYAADGSVCTVTITGVTAAASAVTITVTAKKGDTTATATYTVTVTEPVKTELYTQDYSDVGTTNIVTNYRLNTSNKVPSLQATKDSVTTVLATTLGYGSDTTDFAITDGYLNWVGTSLKARYLNTMEDLGAKITSGSYGVSFDIQIGSGLAYLSLVDSTTKGATNLDILTKYAIADNASETLLLVGLSSTKATLYSAGNETETTFTYDNDSWYRFTIEGTTGENQTMKLTVTKVSDGSTVLATTSYSAVSAKGIPWVIHAAGTSASVALDNIVVWNYQ